MATYVNDLRLKEIATGDESGTWGTSTNTNLELIAEAFSYGTEAITTNADTHTTTIADGSTDPGRSIYLKYTGTLDSACTITIGPNTVSKLWFIENGTSGSQNIILSQGSGANITIPAGDTKVVYSDGAGAGAAFVDAFASLNVGALTGTSLDISGDIDVDGTTNLDVVDIDGALTQDGGAVFNEASADVDFRVESDGNANMLFVNGGTNCVGIGTSSPACELEVNASAAGNIIRISKAGNAVGTIGASDSASSDLTIFSTTASHVGLSFGNTRLSPSDNVGATTDGVADLGFSTTRWKDLYISGGVNFGATGGAVSSKTLDDYEEGTWRPTIAGQTSAGTYTYGENAGVYTKIGNQVTCTFYIVDITEVSAGSGNLIINNFPFTAANVTAGTIMDYYWGSCNLEYFDVNSATVNIAVGMDAGSTSCLFWETLDANVNGIIAVTDLNSSGNADIWGQVTYRTT